MNFRFYLLLSFSQLNTQSSSSANSIMYNPPTPTPLVKWLRNSLSPSVTDKQDSMSGSKPDGHTHLSCTENMEPTRSFINYLYEKRMRRRLKYSGSFSSPNYPASLYPASSSYVWYLQAAEGKHLKLTLHFLDIENAFDILQFGHYIEVKGNFTGMSLTYYSYGQYEDVLLVSDQTVQRRGFTASFSSVYADDRRYSARDRAQCVLHN